MKKVIIVLLAVVMAALCASCGEEEKPAAKDDSVVIQITSREAQGHDEINIKEETVEIKGKKSTQATEPNDPTEPTKKKKKKKKNKSLSNIPTQGDVNPNPNVQVTTAPNGSFSDADLKFVYEGAYILLNDDIEDAEAILGDDIGADELSKTKTQYDFDGVTIVTYKSGEDEKIEQITVTSDVIATKKGAKVGMYGTQLRTIYGVPNSKSETAYVYSKGDKSLTFTLQNNVIASYIYKLKH